MHVEFVSGDFHTISWFFSKIWMFWTEYDILVWGEADFMVVSPDFSFGFEFWLDHFCFSVHLAALEGAMPNLQVKKFAGEKVPCQICRKKNSR